MDHAGYLYWLVIIHLIVCFHVSNALKAGQLAKPRLDGSGAAILVQVADNAEGKAVREEMKVARFVCKNKNVR